MALKTTADVPQGELLVRDHLFISYAQEDRSLAEWLTRKLTADGYRVWCDRFSLLAGESYPTKIDVAIKDRAFRVLAILSHASIEKPNPLKERTLALKLGEQRKEDFLIPLNVNLSSTQLDWMTSDLNYISFSNWAEGYALLLKTLHRLSTPRPLLQQGRSAAIESFSAQSLISSVPEQLYTNCIPIQRIPRILRAFSTSRSLPRGEFATSSGYRRAYWVNPRTLLSFEKSLTGITKDLFCTAAGQWLWDENSDILRVPAVNVVSTLLNRSFSAACIRKGLRETPDSKSLFFPSGLVKENKIHFTGFNGKTWLLVVGQRIFRNVQGEQQICIHHLSFRHRVRQHLFNRFVIQLKVGLHLTDIGGAIFKARTGNSRRKKITKNWWNDKWLNRHLAICEFLDDGGDILQLGGVGDSAIVASTKLITVQAPFGIDEHQLEVDLDEFRIPTEESEIIETEDDAEPVDVE